MRIILNTEARRHGESIISDSKITLLTRDPEFKNEKQSER